MCAARFGAPVRTASTFSARRAGSSGLPATILPTPPCIFRARTVVTITASSGLSPDARHLISKNFSAPMSAPKPASVHTISLVASARRSARTEFLPWAMFANGPQWTKAGPPSRVWSRLGLIASSSRTVIAPATLVLEGDQFALHRRADDHPAEPAAQILQIGGKGQDRHDLRGDRDHRLALAGQAVLTAAQADHDPAQCPVADVDNPRPADREGVDSELVAVVDRVVQEGGSQVVGRPDRVDVAGQVEVEILHRDDLAIAAPSRPPLDPEARPQRRLARRARRPPADPIQALGEADRGRRFT